MPIFRNLEQVKERSHLVFAGAEHASLLFCPAPAAEMHARVLQTQSQSRAQKTEETCRLYQTHLQVPLF